MGFLSWLRAFSSPCTILAAVALAAGLAGGGFAAKLWYSGQVADLRVAVAAGQTALAEQRAGLAERSQAATLAAYDLGQKAEALAKTHEEGQLAALTAGQRQVAGQVAAIPALFREYTNDPRYNCRRLPLPDAVLDGLRRPAG